MRVYMTKTERESLPEWMYGDAKAKLYPVTSQKEIYNAPSRIAAVRGERRELIKWRMIRAALRQGFKLPKPFQEEYTNMSTGKVRFTDSQRETLRTVAEVIEEFGVAIFRDEPSEADEIAEVKRQAEAYADRVNGKRAEFTGDGDEDARLAAEKFADDFNRRHGARR